MRMIQMSTDELKNKGGKKSVEYQSAIKRNKILMCEKKSQINLENMLP